MSKLTKESISEAIENNYHNSDEKSYLSSILIILEENDLKVDNNFIKYLSEAIIQKLKQECINNNLLKEKLTTNNLFSL